MIGVTAITLTYIGIPNKTAIGTPNGFCFVI